MSRGARKFYAGAAIAAGVVLTVQLSVWFRAAYLPYGIWGPADDQLFLRLAQHIGKGEWLGPYDSLTLAKGAFFPLFMALNKAAGLPLKISEHLVFLSVSLFAAATLARLCGKRWLLLPLFVTLAFCPIAWMVEFARVLRDPLYQSLGLLLFCLTACHFLGRGKAVTGIALGLVAGCYWLTREEGLWLAPALAVLALPWAVQSVRQFIRTARAARGRLLRELALRMVLPLAVFALPVLLADGVNLAAYGVFRNNDFRSGPFPAAYGALARIRHDAWERYVVFPRDARERAYAVSAAVRELKPFFEDPGWAASWAPLGKPWGCANEAPGCKDEILSGWFVWALRAAVAAAGHYGSAAEADAFYVRLADEINAACDAQAIPCSARREDLFPVWRERYLQDSLHAGGRVLLTLLILGGGNVGAPPSPLTREQAREFRLALNSRISGFNEDDERTNTLDPTHARVRYSKSIALAYVFVFPFLFLLALAVYGVMLFSWLLIRFAAVKTTTIALLTALLAAILARSGLLGFLEATSLPANNMLYLAPAVPFYLLFVVTSLGAGLAAARAGWRGRAAKR